MDWFRYALARDWRRPPKHPTPHPHWQQEEYEANTGKIAKTLYPEDWQWQYNPRSAKSRAKMKEWLENEETEQFK